MALPKEGVSIPSSSQFAKLQSGVNKFRILSDIKVGWEGWKTNKPFRQEGNICKIKPEQVDMSTRTGLPNINYFWVMVVWDYREKRISTLEITQKTVMTPLQDLENNSEWGDLNNYDIEINKKVVGDKTSYTVQAIPPKPLSIT